MHRRFRYLVWAVGLLVAAVVLAIYTSAAIRYNRDAGLFDVIEPDHKQSRNLNPQAPGSACVLACRAPVRSLLQFLSLYSQVQSP